MIGLLTCLFLIVLAGLSAEAVRATCRRRLMTPLTSQAQLASQAPLAAVRTEPSSPSIGTLELVGARALG